MIARSNKIIHPSGIEIETPLLVPSFSSKGFGFKQKNKKRGADISEVTDALVYSKEFLTESLLVSAYDIYYKHIPLHEENFTTNVSFIDSGGYETGDAYDISATTKYNYDLKNWTVTHLKEVLYKWPQNKASIIVSFDHGNHRIALNNQIKDAKTLFSEFPDMLSDFLIKPETKQQKYIQVEKIIELIKDLKSFDIIGVTERELGNSVLQRMVHLWKIREALDSSKNNAPIHVFGSLDPITSILYFLAGAEIFDGLTWLKYSYFHNSAIYTSNFGILSDDLGIHAQDKQVKTMAITKNAYYLEKMKYIMKDFLNTNDFKLFDSLGNGFGEIIERSYNTFKSNI